MGFGAILSLPVEAVSAGFTLIGRAARINANPHIKIENIAGKAAENAPLRATIVNSVTDHFLQPGISNIHHAGTELGTGGLKSIFKSGGLDKLSVAAKALGGRGAIICGIVGLASVIGGKLAYDTISNKGYKIAMMGHGQVTDPSNSKSLLTAEFGLGWLQGIGAGTIALGVVNPLLIPIGLGSLATGLIGNMAIGAYKKVRHSLNIFTSPETSTIPWAGDLMARATGRI